jgi:hypothetical protein
VLNKKGESIKMEPTPIEGSVEKNDKGGSTIYYTRKVTVNLKGFPTDGETKKLDFELLFVQTETASGHTVNHPFCLDCMIRQNLYYQLDLKAKIMELRLLFYFD